MSDDDGLCDEGGTELGGADRSWMSQEQCYSHVLLPREKEKDQEARYH